MHPRFDVLVFGLVFESIEPQEVFWLERPFEEGSWSGEENGKR